MTSTALIVIGLFAAGLACGAWRHRWPTFRCGPTIARSLVGAAILVPVCLISLAKLFDSNVLGWMFGLTLMLGLALIPCGIVFGVGFLIGSRVGRRGRVDAPPGHVPGTRPLTIRVDRDGVRSGDDAGPHDRIVDDRAAV